MARLYAFALFASVLVLLTVEAAKSAPAPWLDAKDRWLAGPSQP